MLVPPTFFASRARSRNRLFAALAAASAVGVSAGDASAADLLTCTGTELDLRAELLADVPNNGLTPTGGNPAGAAGPLDDGGVLVSAALVAQVFPDGIPFIQNFDELWVNVNGTLTFEDRLATFTPEAIPGLSQPTIAAYFGDVDLRPVAAPPASFTLCLEPDNDRLFVTWQVVGYYNQKLDLLNSFQVVLTDNDAAACPSAGNFEVEFRYQQLEWTTGDASGGVGGLGGNQATAGIDAGDTVNAVALPGSGTAAVLNLVTETNVDDPGVFRYLVAEGTLPDCGNTVLNLCEECDDGDDDNNDGCTNLCLNAFCGDELIRTGVEQCDISQIDGMTCPAGYAGTPLCNNDPQNPAGNGTCTFDALPDGCTDQDECALGTDDCDVNAGCINLPGTFDCVCNVGFVDVGGSCVDIDECATNTDGCDVNATCTNTPPGSFTCTCNAGFAGDGITCDPVGGQGGGGGGGQGGAGAGGDGGAGVGGVGGQGVGGAGGQGVGGAGGQGVGGAGGQGVGGQGVGGAGGQGGSGVGGDGQGGVGEGAGGPATGSTATGATAGSTTAAGVTSGGTGGDDGAGDGDGIDAGVVASGGCNCDVPAQAPGRDAGFALVALAGLAAARRRRPRG